MLILLLVMRLFCLGFKLKLAIVLLLCHCCLAAVVVLFLPCFESIIYCYYEALWAVLTRKFVAIFLLFPCSFLIVLLLSLVLVYSQIWLLSIVVLLLLFAAINLLLL